MVRIPVAGGAEERITTIEAGPGPVQESIDGTTLLFKRTHQPSPLFAQPLAGGPEREVAKCVGSFAVVKAGLFTFDCSDEEAKPLYVRETATGQRRLVARLEGAQGGGLSVSSDGQVVLFARWSGEGSDLMMIENFR